MKCDKDNCDGVLRSRHTHTVAQTRFQDRQCDKCLRRVVVVAKIHPGEESAYVLANRARRDVGVQTETAPGIQVSSAKRR